MSEQNGTYPSLEPLRHLAAGRPEQDGASPWRSTGDDPGFRIRLPLVRKRYLAIRLHGHDQTLEPQLYFNFGDGFREKDSIAITGGNDICLTRRRRPDRRRAVAAARSHRRPGKLFL